MERILNFFRKKDQYRDLSVAVLEEEINTLITPRFLFKNDRNSLLIKNSANALTKDQINEADGFDHNTSDQASKNENSSTSTEENKNHYPKDPFSVLMERLDTLQKFFLNEVSDINAEIKNICNQTTSTEISAGNDEETQPLQNQVIYLKEGCNSKSKLRSILSEILCKSNKNQQHFINTN